VVTQFDLTVGDGRTLRAYDTQAEGFPVFWHHGTPNLGLPPEPLFPAAERLGLRWVSYDRPGYGGSTPRPDRDVASAAADVAAIADALGLDRFAVVGHSGGGPHALACGALLGGRVVGVISIAGLAPYGVDGLDWFAGMTASGQASLQAARQGPDAKQAYEHSGADYDPEFIPADRAALEGDWAWLGRVTGAAAAAGPGGLIADDLAYVNPWGFDPTAVGAPILLLHGGRDRIVPSMHGQWLAERCPTAHMRLSTQDGHISVLTGAPAALEWLHSFV
jgi:pimeloyl-ACP methyl ester carboxylesterase